MRDIMSFRDPRGFVHVGDRHVYRFITQGNAEFQELLECEMIQKLTLEKKLVDSQITSLESVGDAIGKDSVKNLTLKLDEHSLVIEHPKVPFISYPYEWCHEMLSASAELSLDIAMQALENEYLVKDATPYNVIFDGPRPIFVDLLSFEKRHFGEYIWIAHAQFIRMFYLPLLAQHYFKLPVADLLINHRDGIEVDYIYNLCSIWTKLRPPFFTNVFLPHWLGKMKGKDEEKLYKQKHLSDDKKAKYIYLSVLKHAKKQLLNISAKKKDKSTWTDYMDNCHYAAEQQQVKVEIINRFLTTSRPKRVLDVGCNNGFFSTLAAKAGSKVVAIDNDSAVIGRVWRKAYDQQLDILPLVVNIARPTPAAGWWNKECYSFLERAKGSFDAVFMLAVVHHIWITERIPLVEIFELMAELTINYLVIEYIDPADKMFKRLVRGRETLYNQLTLEQFIEASNKNFRVLETYSITETRKMLIMQKKTQ